MDKTLKGKKLNADIHLELFQPNTSYATTKEQSSILKKPSLQDKLQEMRPQISLANKILFKLEKAKKQQQEHFD